MFNKFTFSATRHVQTRENLLIPMNVPMFWFDLLFLIPGVMYKTLRKLAMFAFRILRILSGHHIDHVKSIHPSNNKMAQTTQLNNPNSINYSAYILVHTLIYITSCLI